MTKFNELLLELPHSTLLKLKNLEYLRGILESHYEYPWRHYHNFTHLKDMLSELKSWATLAQASDDHNVEKNVDEMAVAILFHDTVYNLRAGPGENEDASADLAYRHGHRCFDDINWIVVDALISATKHTEDLSSALPHVKLMADMDLHKFAAPYDEFHRVGKMVVDEYVNLYPKKQVLMGRIQFMEKFSQRNTIFFSGAYPNEVAFENINRELDSLKKELEHEGD